MSMYNMMFGISPNAATLMSVLDVDVNSVPRFRNCLLNEVDGVRRILIVTRTGGGNRENFIYENESLRKVPGYLSDDDDGFDTTYAVFTYAVPPEAESCVNQLDLDETLADQWERLKNL